MICGQASCNCAFTSESLVIDNQNGVISLETFGPAMVAVKEDVVSPFTNQIVHETDTGLTWMYDGADWVLYAWTSAPRCLLGKVGHSTTHNVSGQVALDIEYYDTFGWHTGGAPTRITPTIPGFYSVHIQASHTIVASDYSRVLLGCNRNGVAIITGRFDHGFSASGATWSPRGFGAHFEFELNGTTDYVEVDMYQTNAAAAARSFTVVVAVEWKSHL